MLIVRLCTPTLALLFLGRLMPTNDNTMEIGHRTFIYNCAFFIAIYVAKSLVSSVSSVHSQHSFWLPNSLLAAGHIRCGVINNQIW